MLKQNYTENNNVKTTFNFLKEIPIEFVKTIYLPLTG